ncbi:hypothetical protein PLICRDRAFT_27744 [Plicaturopsis crispa FD-325 SS-3]|nr:hypothetical protein PLICRDRAFT_27744 [Plicaturopsis crispa FD-325 SS-3]
MSPTVESLAPFSTASPSLVAYAETPSQSEWESLHGKQALTPIIAGSISGGCVAIGWFIGAILYYNHRRRRKIREKKVALGLKKPKVKAEPQVEQKLIIPPDPAVLQGHAKPGEFIFAEDDRKLNHPAFGHFRHARSASGKELPGKIPATETDMDGSPSLSQPMLSTDMTIPAKVV